LAPNDLVETLVAPTVVAPGAPLPDAPPIDRVAGDVEPAVLARWAWTAGARLVGPPEGLPRADALLELASVPGGAALLADPAGWEPLYGRPAEAQARWEQQHGRLVDPARST
jgi:hypothetical protein